jgi:hypothetical protein
VLAAATPCSTNEKSWCDQSGADVTGMPAMTFEEAMALGNIFQFFLFAEKSGV